MIEEMDAGSSETSDRREQRGTWPWFVLNVILFPAPAHFTLLRIKDHRFGKSLRHLGVTLLLTFALLISGALQVALPGFGRLWMLFPVLSGFIVLYANRSVRGSFKPFDVRALTRAQLYFIVFFALAFTLISVLPDLDLIQLSQRPYETFKSWIGPISLWQDLLIMIPALLLLLTGYLTNAIAPVSINRAVILFACFTMLTSLLWLIVFLAFGWLKIQGGFGTHLTIVLLSVILAIDYWDATSFGQFTRRFFFLTSTKGLCFVFLWLCFLGLPQKAASTLSIYYYNKTRAAPAAVQNLDRYLVFSHRDRFVSAHDAARRLRALYTRAVYEKDPESMHRIASLIAENAGSVLPADADICRLSELIRRTDIQADTVVFDRVPLFRPIHPDWDVMLTALLVQGTISKMNLNDIIADFKAMLPKSAHGRLPNIYTPYKARYVSLATRTQVDFISPRYEFLEALLEKNICPVLSIRLAGKNYWAALLRIDPSSGIVWLRIETSADTGKSIQTIFDADETVGFTGEILSRLMVPLPLKYFRNHLENYSSAVIVFTRAGLENTLPDLVAKKDLAEINHAVAFATDPELSATRPADDSGKHPLHGYADDTRTVALIKAMLTPTPYGQNILSPDKTASVAPEGSGRITEIETLLERIAILRDADRIDIADLLVRNNHTNGAPDLFIRLTTEKMVSSDLIDCGDALRIGRELFLLGYHEKAYRYLELAFLRHPFDAEYELWYHIVREKLGKPPTPFYSPPEHEPHLHLYYQTLVDMRNDRDKAALKRLERALEKDSHDSLATHLLSKYFSRPLDDRQFFPAQEGL